MIVQITVSCLAHNPEVLVSSVIQRAEIRKFEMVSLEGKPLHQPQREVILPHLKALEWHHTHVFRA